MSTEPDSPAAAALQRLLKAKKSPVKASTFVKPAVKVWSPKALAFQPYARQARVEVGKARSTASILRTLTTGLKYLYNDVNHRRLVHSQGGECGECERGQVHTTSDGKLDTSKIKILHNRYRVLSVLGQGAFSQMIAVEDLFSAEKPPRKFAIKVMDAAYGFVGMQESVNVRSLNLVDCYQQSNIIRQYSSFWLGNHLCLVFELLRESLLEYTDNLKPKTIPLHELRDITLQLVIALRSMHLQGVLHADIKPENILLREDDVTSGTTRMRVVLADLGNSIHEAQLRRYFDDFKTQTLFYRAPEVLLGLPFHTPIDMWSLGCLLMELYTGAVLFQVENPADLCHAQCELLGGLPQHVFREGAFYDKYYISKKFHGTTKYSSLTRTQQIRHALGEERVDGNLVSFITQLLDPNPSTRLTARDALCHPFLSAMFPCGLLFPNAAHDTPSLRVRPPEQLSLPVNAPLKTVLNTPSTDMKWMTQQQASTSTSRKTKRFHDGNLVTKSTGAKPFVFTPVKDKLKNATSSLMNNDTLPVFYKKVKRGN